jgi:hypothetical protein
MTKFAALPLLALPLLSPMGAPAMFEVRGAEATVVREAGSAEVRIVYDVEVKDAACGWFLARVDGLPKGAAAPKATLLCDGKEFPAAIEEDDGHAAVQAFRDARKGGVEALSAKSIRVVLAFPKAPSDGPEVSVALPVPVPAFWHRGESGKDVPTTLPRLAVRFDARGGDAPAEVRATFRTVPKGARLVLRSDALSAGAALVN